MCKPLVNVELDRKDVEPHLAGGGANPPTNPVGLESFFVTDQQLHATRRPARWYDGNIDIYDSSVMACGFRNSASWPLRYSSPTKPSITNSSGFAHLDLLSQAATMPSYRKICRRSRRHSIAPSNACRAPSSTSARTRVGALSALWRKPAAVATLMASSHSGCFRPPDVNGVTVSCRPAAFASAKLSRESFPPVSARRMGTSRLRRSRVFETSSSVMSSHSRGVRSSRPRAVDGSGQTHSGDFSRRIVAAPQPAWASRPVGM